MRIIDCTSTQKSDSKIESILKGKFLLDEFTAENGFVLVICGPPGAGKTTFGLFLLHYFYHKIYEQKSTHPNALILSLVENPEQIDKICEIYNFNFELKDTKSKVFLIPGRFSSGEVPDLKSIARKFNVELNRSDLIIVDGISSFLSKNEDSKVQLNQFLDQIKKNKLISVLIAEEYRDYEDISIQYAVDGIIKLNVDQSKQARILEISKSRWHDNYYGPHVFRLNSKGYNSIDKPGVLLYPSMNCLINERKRNNLFHNNSKQSDYKKELSSGVNGFNGLFSDRKNGPFSTGENVLLIGPNGADKFLFGIQYLEATKSDEKAILISFVKTIKEIYSIYNKLKNLSKKEDAIDCDCLTYSFNDFVIEEAVGKLHNILCKYENITTRVFIDGLSSLINVFDTKEKYQSFLISLLELINTFKNVSAIFSYNTSKVFSSFAEIDIPCGDRFTTVVGFMFQEQYNKLVPGVVILKSQASKCDMSLKVPIYRESGRYEIDLQAGWTRVGLLSGEREQVHEEKPFVKLFYENRSEEWVFKRPIDDFKGRYPKEHSFKMVAKNNPYPDHWSFLGYAGAGHSNTKLVELRKYVMDVLRDREVFLELPNELKKMRIIKERSESGFLWFDNTSSKPDSSVYIPFYADVGVLVYQEDKLKKLLTANDLNFHIPKTWDDIIELIDCFEPFDDIRHLFLIPNTVGDAKNFVSFFIELTWTYGWHYPTDLTDNEQIASQMSKWIRGPYFINSAKLLKKMVQKGKGSKIPNPNIGGHYHESIFSRRWFSKIHLFPNDAEKRAQANKGPFYFGIAPLPGIKDKDKFLKGISNVDLYPFGIIRSALAPETGWMLAVNLLETDIDRAIRKRGIPIGRKVYRTQIIQDSLCSPPHPPNGFPDFYSGQEELFKEYGPTLNEIIENNESTYPRFRRTSDIKYFFKVEEKLTEYLPSLFEVSIDEFENKIMDKIEKEIVELYHKKTSV